MTPAPDGCGLDPATINPPDAVAALRSYPRRFRALLTEWEDDEGEGDDPDAVARRRPEPGGWSALDHLAHVVSVFDGTDGHVRRALTSDRPALDPVGVPAPGGTHAPVAAVLDDLTAAAERLAATVAGVPADGWRRTGRVRDGDGSGERTVLDLVREAVHQGHHHLRDVERVLRAARRG